VVPPPTKVWEARTGVPIFEFVCLWPGEEEAAGITSFVLDATCGRLITGQTNGRVTAWNYNNGQRLRSYDQGSGKEITDLVYASCSARPACYFLPAAPPALTLSHSMIGVPQPHNPFTHATAVLDSRNPPAHPLY